MNTSPERRHLRRPLELRVQFRSDREGPMKVGLGTNLSPGGVFIASLETEEAGTRVEVRFVDRGGFVVEGEVIHARHGGMGVRFLPLEEVVSSFLASPADCPDGPAAGTVPARPADAPQQDEPDPAATESRLGDGCYEMAYADRQQLERAYERDARTGGWFVPTRVPAALGASLELRVRLSSSPAPPALLRARVVHVTSSGMGVEFADRAAALSALAALLDAGAAAGRPAAAG